ncbi:hypothetical protein NPIL_680531 [Nephila pilipes]|uniref:Uncharacterized protein n=1 Tax=Nephila pilipes TaxID=299642 RepID=A0A8X6TIJ4_NEPPI|nr:hypothetical protein NPIL_680531 [Nephila pilipes]
MERCSRIFSPWLCTSNKASSIIILQAATRKSGSNHVLPLTSLDYPFKPTHSTEMTQSTYGHSILKCLNSRSTSRTALTHWKGMAVGAKDEYVECDMYLQHFSSNHWSVP